MANLLVAKATLETIVLGVSRPSPPLHPIFWLRESSSEFHLHSSVGPTTSPLSLCLEYVVLMGSSLSVDRVTDRR